MNRLILLLMMMAIGVSGCTKFRSHRSAPEASPANVQDSFAVALQQKASKLLAAHKVPGAVVSYIKNGDVIWTKAFGVANLRTGAPMQPDMIFNHGSNGKVLTAWGIMRLVEAGRIELDAPANRYLKRWKIRSQRFDPDGVTLRRLLSHTAGLTARGFSDYEEGARLPTLIEVLEGKNQSNGGVYIKWEPGTTNVYSGGGFVLLQMVIEDVSGESFAAFMKREVTQPLGLESLEWTWTPDLEARAAVPYDGRRKEVGYRQLAAQAVGSEVCTVPDFARFIAAAVPGPKGEAPGRGVLKPETIAEMIEVQPNARHIGLGYGIGFLKDEKFLSHAGANPGWNARFQLNVNRKEGVVIANNSSRGAGLNDAIVELWLQVSSVKSESTMTPRPNPF
jgi:CubicO group peptidase (beta-lactamase class C family)